MVVRFPSAAKIVETLQKDATLGVQCKDQQLLKIIGDKFAYKETVVSRQSQEALLMIEPSNNYKGNTKVAPNLIKDLLAALDRVPREIVVTTTCHKDKEALLKALKQDPKLNPKLKDEKLLEALAEIFSHKEVAFDWRSKQSAVAKVLENFPESLKLSVIQEYADALDRIPNVMLTQVMR